MSEFRLNPATNEWVIIAADRAKRPDAYHRHDSEKMDFPEWEEDCPFCFCNEHMTPHEIYRDPSAPDASGESRPWQVRIVPNLYPALNTSRFSDTREGGDFFHRLEGVGLHDVVIEHSEHNRFTPLMNADEIERVLCAFRWRFEQIREDPRIRLITIFKNHGRSAGTSPGPSPFSNYCHPFGTVHHQFPAGCGGPLLRTVRTKRLSGYAEGGVGRRMADCFRIRALCRLLSGMRRGFLTRCGSSRKGSVRRLRLSRRVR